MRDRIGEKQLGIDPLEGVAPAYPRILSTERSKVDRKRRPDGFQPGYFSGLLSLSSTCRLEMAALNSSSLLLTGTAFAT